MGIVQVGLILGGDFLWWKFSGWELSGGNHPGGGFHVTIKPTMQRICIPCNPICYFKEISQMALFQALCSLLLQKQARI